jgi:4-amino-4-deoxy-L-arabinose transferase-like glycosyltransferase
MTAPARARRRYLIALLCVFVAKQLVTAFLFPPFTGHDEVSHFQYLRVLATEGRVPTWYTHTLPADLYEYHQYALGFDDESTSPLYTSLHPPLYFALMVPLYRLSSGMPPESIQYLLRCAAIPFGVLVVWLAYLIARAIFPHDAFLAVTVPAVVAFQPQISYEAAMVNNDIAAIAFYSWLLYLLVVTIRDGACTARRGVLIGCVAGLGLLTKGTTVMAFGLIPAAFWMARRDRRWTSVARAAATACAVALLIVGPWWWFMTRTYGDPMAYSALAVLQPDLTRNDATFLSLLVSGTFLIDRWVETWGEFGWKMIHISGALTAALAVVGVTALIGLVTYARPETGGGSEEAAAPGTRKDTLLRWQRHALLLLGAACILSYLGVVQFGTRFVLTQARYFFPVVDAAALLMMVGLRAWIPGRWHPLAQGALVLLAIAVDVTIYAAYVVPYWYS